MNDNKLPKVSVCIPTYNYERFIGEAIESVLAQTFGDFELIVVDNCSTDNTRDLVGMYAKKDARVVYFCNERNLGMVGNWNQCLKYASGEYVKILCADDLIESTCLEESVRLMESNPGVVLVSSARRLVSETLQPMGVLEFSKQEERLHGLSVIRSCLLKGNVIGEPTAVLFRRSKALRGFSERYHHIVDLELWLYILAQGDFAFTPKVLCSFRQHCGQGTVENLLRGEFIDDLFFLIDDYGKLPSLGLGFWGRRRARYNMARTVWSVRKHSVGVRALLEMRKHFSPTAFVILQFFTRLMKLCRKLG